MKIDQSDMDRLVNKFSKIVMDKVIACPQIPGAENFIQVNFIQRKCYINSATPQNEIRQIVSARGLQKYFHNVLGSPSSKSAFFISAAIRIGTQTGAQLKPKRHHSDLLTTMASPMRTLICQQILH